MFPHNCNLKRFIEFYPMVESILNSFLTLSFPSEFDLEWLHRSNYQNTVIKFEP